MRANIFSQAYGGVFIGFMFIGIAVGMYYNLAAIGTLASMGVGFIAQAIISLNKETAKTKKTIQL